MIDRHLGTIRSLEDQGFVVLLKWDGGRTSRKRTVIISKPGVDEAFRKDADDVEKVLTEALAWAVMQTDVVREISGEASPAITQDPVLRTHLLLGRATDQSIKFALSSLVPFEVALLQKMLSEEARERVISLLSENDQALLPPLLENFGRVRVDDVESIHVKFQAILEEDFENHES